MQQFEGRTQENHIVRYFRFNAAESQRCKRSSLEFCIRTDLCHASLMLSVICLFLNLFYMIRCSLVLAAKWCVQLAVLNYSKKHSFFSSVAIHWEHVYKTDPSQWFHRWAAFKISLVIDFFFPLLSVPEKRWSISQKWCAETSWTGPKAKVRTYFLPFTF